jgi:integrase/recombinase XerD
MLNDEDVNEFLGAMGSGSKKVYSAGLEAFQTFYKKPLSGFLDEVESDMKLPRRQRKRVARNVLKEFVRFCQERGYKPKTIRVYVGAVQSFTGYYDIKISTRYVDLPASLTVSHKFPWTLEKVAEFIDMIGDLKYKTIAVVMFQSGLSISDVLALTYEDIKYEYEHGIVPLCLDLTRIKTDVPFMSFIGKWGVSLLRQCLPAKLRLQSPLFQITSRSVEIHLKRLAEKFVGEYTGQNPVRPHSLRAAFRTILGDAGADRDVVEFWMGHKLPEQQRVYHSRSRDGWRSIYQKYEDYLTPKNWKKLKW